MIARKRIAIVVVLAGIAVAMLVGMRAFLGNEMSLVGVGEKAPDFSVVTVTDAPQQKTLRDYRGEVVLLNIWATWCVPCRVEMPSIEKLHKSYAGRGLKVLAVSVDEAGMAPQIRSFAKQHGLTFEILHDPEGQTGNVTRAYQINGYPETIIVGRDGVIRRKLLGAHDWNSAENRALIERLLTEKSE